MVLIENEVERPNYIFPHDLAINKMPIIDNTKPGMKYVADTLPKINQSFDPIFTDAIGSVIATPINTRPKKIIITPPIARHPQESVSTFFSAIRRTPQCGHISALYKTSSPQVGQYGICSIVLFTSQ